MNIQNLIVILSLILASCGVPECPDNEKVLDRYETVTYGDVTTTEAIYRCPN